MGWVPMGQVCIISCLSLIMGQTYQKANISNKLKGALQKFMGREADKIILILALTKLSLDVTMFTHLVNLILHYFTLKQREAR